jgi:hypothetical protein
MCRMMHLPARMLMTNQLQTGRHHKIEAQQPAEGYSTLRLCFG